MNQLPLPIDVARTHTRPRRRVGFLLLGGYTKDYYTVPSKLRFELDCGHVVSIRNRSQVPDVLTCNACPMRPRGRR